MDGKRIFCVAAGEEFDIHIIGPNPSCVDPAGEIGGSTFEFRAQEDRKDLVRTGERLADFNTTLYVYNCLTGDGKI
jgi:hypothetical protein